MSGAQSLPFAEHSALQASAISRSDLGTLLQHIATAATKIGDVVRHAVSLGLCFGSGEINSHGEEIKEVDRRANDILADLFTKSGLVAAMASEEERDVIEFTSGNSARYVIALDPLDGSDNVGVSLSVGTIFSVYERRGGRTVLEDFLRPGKDQVCAGYVLYGSATVLVYTLGISVDCFELNHSSGQFELARARVQTPTETSHLSVNESNCAYWPNWVRPLIDSIQSRNVAEGRRVISRFVGTLVADFHRNLLRGGLIIMPPDSRTASGKLRLLFECNPMSFIAKVAGGAASDGTNPILEILPTDIHQRSALILGTPADVQLAQSLAKMQRENLGSGQ